MVERRVGSWATKENLPDASASQYSSIRGHWGVCEPKEHRVGQLFLLSSALPTEGLSLATHGPCAGLPGGSGLASPRAALWGGRAAGLGCWIEGR